MSTEVELASIVLAPTSGNGLETLDQTGVTESVNQTVLKLDRYATIQAGTVAVRVVWNSSSSDTGQVATTDFILAAGMSRDWVVKSDSKYVHVEAADGASAYQAWVWQSGQ